MPWGAIYSTSMYSASVADKSEKVAISSWAEAGIISRLTFCSS